MGKGNRNKIDRENQASELDKYLTRSDKSKRQAEARKGKIISAICIILVVAILLILVGTVLDKVGVFSRLTTVIELDGGKYKIDKSMMNFFFNEQIMTWYSNYGGYATYFGLDFSKDLRYQQYSTDTTWYDYFLSQTKEQVQLYLAYANAAHEMGLKLDDADKQEIDEILDNLDTYINNLGLSYSSFYGDGVGKGVIKDCYEIIYLANKYSEKMSETYKNEIEGANATDAKEGELVDYRNNHMEDFYSADVLKYQIKLDEKSFKNAKAYDEAIAAAKERALKLKDAKSTEEFFELIKADLELIEEEKKENDKKENSSESESASNKPSESATQKVTEPDIEDYRENIQYSSEGKDDVKNWLFGIEEATEASTSTAATKSGDEPTEATEKLAPAESGDTFLEEASETYTEKVTASASESTSETASESASETSTTSTTKTYRKYTVTVYCVETPMDLDYEPVRNLAYVLSSDKSQVQEIYNKFKEGILSAEELDNLGKNASEALPDDTTISIGHAHSKETLPGYFRDNSFGKIDDWLEEEGRKNGDLSGILELKPSTSSGTTYYAVVYLENSKGNPTWYVNAVTGAINDRFENWYKGEGGQLTKTPPKYNDSALGDLYQTVVPYLLTTATSSTSTS